MARILLVDDPPGAALAAVEALGLGPARGRHQIDTVSSVAEARRRSAAERYDLVLLHPERLLGGPDGDEVLRETFDVFEDGLCLVSPEGALEIANASGARLYGGPLQDDLAAAAREAITRGSAADRGMSQGGRAFVVRAFPLPGRGAILYVRDATDERERELGRLQAEKLASIGLLAAGVAHEINNPAAFVLANIDALSGHLRLIEERLRDPEAEGTRALSGLLFEANVILQESKEGMARIHRIVRDLGSFSHRDEEANVPMNVNAAIDSAMGMLRNELKYRARVERDLRAARLVRASAPRLGQVFLNLILNAAQALDEADAKRNVVIVRSFDEGSDVVVEVADNGPGIAAEVLPRIFESFFTTKPRGMGTGLGLPISLGIVRTLGGEIVVDSRPGQGATFRVRLPADESVPERTSTATPAAAPTRGYPRRRVLAIDDEALLLKAYRRMLGDAHELTCTLGGAEAMRVLEREAAFDAVLCDLQMPEMSGMEVHAAVRERHPALADRFIFVTGGAFSSDARKFLEESVSAVIQKPFRLEDMMALIERTARGAGSPAPSDPDRPASRVS